MLVKIDSRVYMHPSKKSCQTEPVSILRVCSCFVMVTQFPGSRSISELPSPPDWPVVGHKFIMLRYGPRRVSIKEDRHACYSLASVLTS
jgi:hypothetical protein